MKSRTATIFTAGLASAIALSAGIALAGGKADEAEVRAFLKAPHGIEAAIKTAEGATGGKAVGAEFDEKKGAGIWEVETVNGTKRAEVRVDATTGEVEKTKDKGDVADDDEPVTPDMLGGTLSDLVVRAETAGGGKVMSIDFEHEDGAPKGLAVEIAKPDGSHEAFLMNPADGKFSPMVDQSDDGEADEGEASGG